MTHRSIRRKMLPPLRPAFAMSFTETNMVGNNETFSRASTANTFNTSGDLVSVAIDTPRWWVDPSGLIRPGKLLEPTATNSIRNNTAAGAVVAGANPNFWNVTGSGNGLVQSVTSLGTENGIEYIGIRYVGIPLSNQTVAIAFEQNNQIAALISQVWSTSAFVKIEAGDMTNITGGNASLVISERDAAGGFLTFSANIFTPTTSNLNLQYLTHVRTLTNASTAFVRPAVQFSVTTGNAIDITLRIGLPQLEQNPFPTSPIRTSTVAVVRAADSDSIDVTALGYVATNSTIFVEGSIPVLSAGVSSTIANLDGGSNNDRITLYYDGPGNRIGLAMFAGGVTQAAQNIPSTLNAITHYFKTAIAAELNNVNGVTNGVAGTNDTSATMPAAANKFWLGRRFSGLGQPVIIHSARFYVPRLSDAVLVSITS